ncbi:MAG: RagB/SusD family nutrient uptake outer membrane protein [Clostridium sp.]|nr:RagB/SusD family nutrient uptake outer membrane protein [Clostridium sp.]
MKRISNKLIQAMVIAGTGLMTVSCADFLDIKPLDLVTDDNYWDERSDVEQMINGLYTRMQDYDFLSRVLVWGELRSDNVYQGEETLRRDASVYNITRENILANNAYASWTPFYSVINRCNLIIEKAPEVAVKDPSYTESDLRATLAEARTIRALCYFYLIRTFRDVPYYTYSIQSDEQDPKLPATPFNEVLAALINDLEDCKGDALVSYVEKENNPYRVTRNSINALLADMYLWQQNYDLAAKRCDDVMKAKRQEYDNAVLQGSSLSSTVALYGRSVENEKKFALLREDWSGNNTSYGRGWSSAFCDGGSYESLLELHFDSREMSGYAKNAVVGSFYGGMEGNQLRPGGFVAPSTTLAGDVTQNTLKYFTSAKDVRAYLSFYSDGTASGNTQITKYAARLAQVTYSNNVYRGSVGYSSQNSANWIFYRLTDVMLMKAEALVCQMQDGQTAGTMSETDKQLCDSAFNLVYAVNLRSLMGISTTGTHTDALQAGQYNNKTTLLAQVMRERQCELLFEGKRWFDLVRRALREGNTLTLRNAVRDKFKDEATAADHKLAKMDAIFWPIHTNELNLNPNLEQNPAYGGVDNSYESTY